MYSDYSKAKISIDDAKSHNYFYQATEGKLSLFELGKNFNGPGSIRLRELNAQFPLTAALKSVFSNILFFEDPLSNQEEMKIFIGENAFRPRIAQTLRVIQKKDIAKEFKLSDIGIEYLSFINEHLKDDKFLNYNYS